MDWENHLQKKIRSIQKIEETVKNQSEISACEQKTTSEKWKFSSNKKIGLEWTLNGFGKPFSKKARSKKLKQ